MKNQPTIARRLFVTFVPQEWINNQSVPCGATEQKDATDHLLQLRLSEIHALRDRDISSDEFVDALAWAHYGPFEVRVVQAVKEYFGVGDLSDITQSMFDDACAGKLPPLGEDASDEDRSGYLRSWMLTYGEHALLFACEAEDIRHAIEQCENANPGDKIIGAFEVPAACLGRPATLNHVEHLRDMVSHQTDAALSALI